MTIDRIDDAIIEALTHDVRVLTLNQIARHRWLGAELLGEDASDSSSVALFVTRFNMGIDANSGRRARW